MSSGPHTPEEDAFCRVVRVSVGRGQIDAIATAEGRKDEAYKTRFDGWPLPRLWDYHQAAKKRS